VGAQRRLTTLSSGCRKQLRTALTTKRWAEVDAHVVVVDGAAVGVRRPKVERARARARRRIAWQRRRMSLRAAPPRRLSPWSRGLRTAGKQAASGGAPCARRAPTAAGRSAAASGQGCATGAADRVQRQPPLEPSPSG